MKDEDLDTSDIPELTAEQFPHGVRRLLYRSIEKPITIRLDADVIAWLQKGGRGYQTQANRLLRSALVESYSPKKEVHAAGATALGRKKKSGTR
jgi:uncharacterized protein (DUF4415 family)